MEILDLAQKARTNMQTKLRMPVMLAMPFVAGLLWTSALAGATAPAARVVVKANSVPATKKVFGGKTKYVGLASWYGKAEQGHKMANGVPFDRRKMTAAAWNIPLGTMCRVINLKNGNSVDVTVTDRGPHPRLRRAIDLSEAAATELDYISTGLTSVWIIPMPKGHFESLAITAQLIELADEMPVQFDVPESQPAVLAAALIEDGPDQSR
jgi:rare lipoprotein A (peptidoglycan hydrolase)